MSKRGKKDIPPSLKCRLSWLIVREKELDIRIGVVQKEHQEVLDEIAFIKGRAELPRPKSKRRVLK